VRYAPAMLAALVLAGCGGGSKSAEEGPPRDVKLEQANSAGTQALSMELPSVAVRQYKLALKRAYERDDAEAIGDTAYNLALAQMQTGDSKAALATVRETRAELERRHAPAPSELILVQAAATYRLGDAVGADQAAQEVLDRPVGNPEAAARAWYIKGIVAAERGERAVLAQAIAALPAAKLSASDGDRDELLGRQAVLDGHLVEAQATFERSAGTRQQLLDYRGMARALALAGDAALKAGRSSEAAVLFLRAGRSDLLQGDEPAALALLQKAESAASESNQKAVIDEVVRLRSGLGKARG
jgi:hypothetical protein